MNKEKNTFCAPADAMNESGGDREQKFPRIRLTTTSAVVATVRKQKCEPESMLADTIEAQPKIEQKKWEVSKTKIVIEKVQD